MFADQSHVRDDARAPFDNEKIPGHDLVRSHVDDAALAMHAGAARDEFGKRLHFAIRTKLVDEPDERVQHEDSANERRVCDLAKKQRNASRYEQDINKGALELAEQDLPIRGRCRGVDSVRAEATQALGSLLISKPSEPNSEFCGDLVEFHRVPLGT